ncbi:rhombosortase [Catenovulum sediminis]|uniref:rhombosortase n=1 Tax=Catenovulum sediminis TaxID=1740262 RepID=UPI001FE90AAE|nr:rhombosortase [Catenovulum sediminis]
MMIPQEAKVWLTLDLEQVNNQQTWRIITGHFLHTNWNHFLLNTLALIALWTLHGQYYSLRKLFSEVLITACLISAALYYFANIQVYTGFSGVLHGLLVWGAFQDIQHKDKTGYLLLAGILIKVVWEQVYGADPATAELIGADVAIEAHLSGTLAGFVYWVGEYAKKQKESI